MKNTILCLAGILLSWPAFTQVSWTLYSSENADLNPYGYSKISVNQEDEICVGGYLGMAYYDGDEWAEVRAYNTDLLNDDVSSVDNDQDGNFWIGTVDGISVFNGVDFIATYDPSNSGMPAKDIVTIRIAPDNKVWMNTKEGSFDYMGVTTFDGTTWETLEDLPTQIDDEEFTDFEFINIATIFMATKNGVALYDGDFSYYPYATTGQWDSEALVMDEDHTIWSVGFDAVLKYDDDEFVNYQNLWLDLPSLLYYDVISVGSKLYMTTTAGIVVFDKEDEEIITIYDESNSPVPANCAGEIGIDSEGNLWFATCEGVAKMSLGGDAIHDGSAGNTITVYPAITAGNVHLNTTVAGNYTVEVRDMFGRILHSAEMNGDISLDFSPYPPATYLVEIEADGIPVATKRIVRL